MGSLLPLSITTNCTMKSLLILATVLAVGHSEETKAVNVAPYNYGFPGYYGGVAAPFVHPQVAPVAYAYAPYAQAYAPVAAPIAAPAPVYATPAVIPPLSSQFLGMNLATPNTAILTSTLPNTKLVTLLVKNQEVTNTLTQLAISKLSPMSPMNWDSELLILDCPLLPFMTLSSQLLPFTNTHSPLLLFMMVLHPLLLRKLLRSSQLKLNILLPLQSLQAGKNVSLIP